ncbi:hypothetical protein C8T65DRAFT_829161 [Cerioporus squamosus]|nr:hypothetical protein C8T65DRAFT_829161 [Cerioporus squamosus]
MHPTCPAHTAISAVYAVYIEAKSCTILTLPPIVVLALVLLLATPTPGTLVIHLYHPQLPSYIPGGPRAADADTPWFQDGCRSQCQARVNFLSWSCLTLWICRLSSREPVPDLRRLCGILAIIISIASSGSHVTYHDILDEYRGHKNDEDVEENENGFSHNVSVASNDGIDNDGVILTPTFSFRSEDDVALGRCASPCSGLSMVGCIVPIW